MTLDLLKVNEVGIITGYDGNKSRKQLLAMGLTRNTQVQVVRVAPLGDPIAIHLYGHKLSLRKKEAESILVK